MGKTRRPGVVRDMLTVSEAWRGRPGGVATSIADAVEETTEVAVGSRLTGDPGREPLGGAFFRLS